jgi:RNA polymerase sigma-70 factor (ECF subfamily)
VDTLLDVTEPTDESLAAAAAREGSDGPAFVTLLERYRQRVWRICFRLLGNEHDAADAAQDVFVQLFLQRGKFAGDSKYATWVHAIAVRTCLTLRRGRGRRQRHETAAADTARAQRSMAPPPAVGLKLDLTQMLDTLEEEDRAMILLKYTEAYSYEELAPIFELSVSACKMRISRARDKIQQQFGGQ